VDKEITAFERQLADKRITLEVADDCRRWLARTGYSTEFGARNIARLVQEKVKNFFVDSVLFGELADGGRAVVEMKGDEVVIEAKAGAPPRKKPPPEKSPRKKSPRKKTPQEKAPQEKTPQEKTPQEKTPSKKS
jgi:hypothetical protein